MNYKEIKENIDVLIAMSRSESPRCTLYHALVSGDVKNDGWVSAALNASDKNILDVAEEFLIADIME
jgi:hypothetical protein